MQQQWQTQILCGDEKRRGDGGWRRLAVLWKVATVVLAAVATGRAGAQALPAATRDVQISTFGAVAERDLRLAGARNTDFTVGLDIGFLPVFGLAPALEVRATRPVVKGPVANEEELLAGLKLGRRMGLLRPYGDALVGWEQMRYPGYGLPVPGQNVFYTKSHSVAVSPGGGVDVAVSNGFALKVDAQYERYWTPVTASGSAAGVVVTVGVVYRLDLGGRVR